MNGPRLAVADSSGNDWGEDAPTATRPRLAAPSNDINDVITDSELTDSIDLASNLVNAPELSGETGLPVIPNERDETPDSVITTSPSPWVNTDDQWSDFENENEEKVSEGTLNVVARKGVAKKKKSKGGGKKGLGMRITERDIEILSFLGRYRAATVNQISRHVDSSLYAIRNRLPRMHKEGMLSWTFTGQAKPKVWTVTDTGLKVAGLNLSAPTISWGTLRHTLGLVDLGTTFELAGEKVVTEREIRAALRYTPTARMKTAIDLHRALEEMDLSTSVDTHDIATTHYTLPVPGKNYGHIPDMVVVRAPFDNGASGSIAVELELNRKTLSEWRNIITAYRDTPHFSQAVYYVVDAEIERALRGVIHALGADHRVTVIRFEPLDTTAIP